MSVEPNKELLECADEEGVYFNNTKLVYSSNQDCVISNIPVVDPGLPPLPPGTVVLIMGVPGTEDGIYEVPVHAIVDYNQLPDSMRYQP
jgi:hypothetical protein